jgi:hypothetical protein
VNGFHKRIVTKEWLLKDPNFGTKMSKEEESVFEA